MYGDNQNAWPQTAPVDVLMSSRQRPKRIGLGAKLQFITGSFAMATGLLAFIEQSPEELGVVGAIPPAVTLGTGIVIALWLLLLMRPLGKGRAWSLRTARWTAPIVAVAYALYFLVGSPWTFVDVFGGGFAPTVFVAALTGLTALALFGCLWGASVREFFYPTPPPMAPGGAQPIGNEADWNPAGQYAPGQYPRVPRP